MILINNIRFSFEYRENVIFLTLDVRSIKKGRKCGLNTLKNGIHVHEFKLPYGSLSQKCKFTIQDYFFNTAISNIEKEHGKP